MLFLGACQVQRHRSSGVIRLKEKGGTLQIPLDRLGTRTFKRSQLPIGSPRVAYNSGNSSTTTRAIYYSRVIGSRCV